MKKEIIVFLILGCLLLPVLVFAVAEPTVRTDRFQLDVMGIMNRIITYVWQFFVGMAVIMFIYSGILFVIANGEPAKITKARMSALWGVVGIIVAIVAFSVTVIIRGIVKI